MLPQTRTVLISPSSRLISSFVNSRIFREPSYEEITIETIPNTSLNFLTPDGAVTLPNQNQSNNIRVAIENKWTRIQTLTGTFNFNNVLIFAGEFHPVATHENAKSGKSAEDNSNMSNGFNPLLIMGIIGAVVGVSVMRYRLPPAEVIHRP